MDGSGQGGGEDVVSEEGDLRKGESAGSERVAKGSDLSKWFHSTGDDYS
jgi:hypothetical protein